MSRAYRISVRESLSRAVSVEDGVCAQLEVLPILEKPRTVELLAHELEQRGFKREGHRVSRDEGEGITTEIDLESGAVNVVAQGHSNLNLETERVAVVEQAHHTEAEKSLRQTAQAALERQAHSEEEVLRREVTEKLEGKLRDLKGELDGVVNRVTGQALRQRAAELGEVQEIHEDASGGLTIKVRV